MRLLSNYLRTRKEKRNVKQTLSTFYNWSSQILTITKPLPLNCNTLAIIRTDDIGDYILFRNMIELYRNSDKFKNYNITLVGNIVWKDIFECFDNEFVNNTIWVDKNQYLHNNTYRVNLWETINKCAFEAVVCPSCTRQLLIDDLITFASGAKTKIANNNTLPHQSLNIISDGLYKNIYKNSQLVHEFLFNINFTNWAISNTVTNKLINTTVLCIKPNNKLNLSIANIKKSISNGIICFVGANAKSKRWPVNYWVQIIKMLQNKQLSPILLGGKQEQDLANAIVNKTKCLNYTGKTSLIETIKLIEQSEVIITGDTMAAHVAAALNKKTIILANGVNANRFVNYNSLNYNNVLTLYTKQYLSYTKNNSINSINYVAVSTDMKSILPQHVFDTLLTLQAR